MNQEWDGDGTGGGGRVGREARRARGTEADSAVQSRGGQHRFICGAEAEDQVSPTSINQLSDGEGWGWAKESSRAAGK